MSMMSSIDLFSGCGGLSLGLKWAGIETVLANDIDFNCQKTYEFNFPESQFLLGDLSEFQKKDFDKYITNRPDFVFGGPPCQAFSLANKNRNILNIISKMENNMEMEFILFPREKFIPGNLKMDN